MNIQNNYTDLNFRHGLTKSIRNEINSCNTHKIVNYLNKEKGINADFKDNKVIAWCTLKSISIIDYLNKYYHTKFAMPYAIYVEDFTKLNVDDTGTTFGILNFFDNNDTYKDKSLATAATIYYNDFRNVGVNSPNGLWDKIDEIMDEQQAHHMSATNFFLEPIFHEFVHAMHEGNLLKKLGNKGIVKFIRTQYSEQNLNNFQKSDASLFSEVSEYAMKSPMEAVACDFSKRTFLNINEETILPTYNFIVNSPYEKQWFIQRFLRNPQCKKDEVLKDIWNGRYRAMG